MYFIYIIIGVYTNLLVGDPLFYVFFLDFNHGEL